MSDVDFWMSEALALARQAAEKSEVPVGALVIHQGKIVGRCHNLRETRQDPVAHAEIEAIREAALQLGSWRLCECILVVTLEPCPMCLAACQQARIERVIYGADDPKGGALSRGYALHQDSRLNHRFLVEKKETPECGRILTEFFQKKRKAGGESMV